MPHAVVGTVSDMHPPGRCGTVSDMPHAVVGTVSDMHPPGRCGTVSEEADTIYDPTLVRGLNWIRWDLDQLTGDDRLALYRN
jgi:hypothetical protein